MRSGLRAERLAWAKRILPVVAWGALDEMLELVQLFGREEIMRRVKNADVDRASAGYSDRFVFQAA